MMKPSGPRADIAECKSIVAQHCTFPDVGDISDHLLALVEDVDRCKTTLKCDDKEAKKLRDAKGDSQIRVAANLCKRAKFVSRMDSYNHKTRA